jgi:hypothetical protein
MIFTIFRMGYEVFPHVRKAKLGGNGLMVKLQKAYCQVLRIEVDPNREEDKREYISAHHFHPLVREMVFSLPRNSKHPRTLSKALGDSINYAQFWAWAKPDDPTEESYWLNIPTVSYQEAMTFYSIMYAEHVQTRQNNTPLLLNYNLISTPKISSSSGDERKAAAYCVSTPQVETIDRLVGQSSALDAHLSSRASGNKITSKARGRELEEQETLAAATEGRRRKEVSELAEMVARMNDSDQELFKRREKKADADLREARALVEEYKTQLEYIRKERDEYKNACELFHDQIDEMEVELARLIEDLNTAYTHPQEEGELCRYSKEVIRSLLARFGGLSRASICSEQWHEIHPEMSKELFGIECNFVQLKRYLKCWWPHKFSDPESMKNVSLDGPMDDFGKCLIARMYGHRPWTQIALGGVFGKSARSVRDYLDEWMPLWGELGRDLYILDTPEEFLKFAAVKEFKDQGLGNVGGLVDGKVYMTSTERKHNAIKQAQWSDKVHHSGVLQHIWTLQCGLIFFATELFFARCTESALVELYGKSSFKGPLTLRVETPRQL